MILSDQSPVNFQDDLPESVDVVVIGGGVIGVSTAWFLLKAGLSVLVCDKGRIAGEQSSRNWGWIRQQARDPDELPIVMTEKDAVKYPATELTDIWYLPVSFAPARDTRDALSRHLSRLFAHASSRAEAGAA